MAPVPVAAGLTRETPAGPTHRRRRGHGSLIFNLAFAVVALVAYFISSSAAPTSGLPGDTLGSFAGYGVVATPVSVSAAWRVPRIEGSAARSASTWIGVQSSAGAFVQVGTLEDCSVDPWNSAPSTQYTAFWSDDDVRFHAQSLGAVTVRAGDLVQASLVQVPKGWRLTIRNARTGRATSLTVPYRTRGFDEAEWFQEDPTDERTNSPVPYPALSAVRFTDVRLNGHAPRLSLGDEGWMSARGQAWAPTPLREDAFTIERRTLSPEQLRWVSALAPLRVAANEFDNLESTWRAHPPTAATARDELRPLELAYATTQRTMTAMSWPLIGRTGLDRLFAAHGQDIDALRVVAAAEPRPTPRDLARLASARVTLFAVEQSVDSRIGLPPT